MICVSALDISLSNSNDGFGSVEHETITKKLLKIRIALSAELN